MKIFIFLVIVTLFATVYAQYSCDPKDDENCQSECRDSAARCTQIMGQKFCSCPSPNSSASNFCHLKPIVGLIIALNIYKFICL